MKLDTLKYVVLALASAAGVVLGLAMLAADGPAVAPIPAAGAVSAKDAHDKQEQCCESSGLLVLPERAQPVIGQFKDTYARLGQPRVLVFVNRTLVDGLGLNAPGAGAAADAGGGAAPAAEPAPTPTSTASPAPTETLVDPETARDVERVFDRLFRLAGVALIDQGSVPVVIGLTAEKANADPSAIDRDAVAKVADVVVEVLIAGGSTTLRECGDEAAIVVPDIQATAIRLSDARVLGQVSAVDVLGRGHPVGCKAKESGLREMVEATALGLMEDMALAPAAK